MKEYWYTFKHRVFPRILAAAAKSILHLIVKTCKVHITGLETFNTTAAKKKCILMFWHNRIALAPEILSTYAPQNHYAALVSHSRDGEIIASITNSYSIGSTIRVPHNAKKAALDETIRQVDTAEKVIIITPDGPKGPKYRIKKGLAYIAKVTGASIVPMSWKADKAWSLKTWDQMLIPKPFTTIKVSFGDPIQLTQSKELPTKAEVESVENHLMNLCES